MNKRTLLLAALCAAASLSGMLSCIDNNYRIDEIDKQVHFAPGGMSFPLGYIEEKSLGEIIGDKISMIGVTGADGEKGRYVLRHEGSIGYTIGKIDINRITFDNLGGLFGTAISVNPKGDGTAQLPSTIAVERKTFETDHNVPSFDMSGESVIENLGLSKQGEIPAGLTGTVPAGQTFAGSFTSGAEATIEINANLPEQIQNVNTVWLKDKDNPSSEVTTVKLALDLGGLAAVTQSLKIDEFSVILPARYDIEPMPHGDRSSEGNSTFTLRDYDMGAGPYVLEFYILKADLSDLTPDNENNIEKTESFSYTIKYTLTTKAGTVGAQEPKVAITGKPDFRDAEFTTKDGIEFEIDPYTYNFSQSVSLDNAIESVSYVAFASSGNSITLKMDDPGLPDAFRGQLPIVIKFPDSFDIAPAAEYDGTTKELTLTATQLVNGYSLKMNGIRLTGTAATPDGNGKITIGGAINVSAECMFGETDLLWSSDIAEKTIPEKITVWIGPDNLAIDYAKSVYTASHKIDESGDFNESFTLPEALKSVSQVLVAKVADGSDAAVEMTLSVEVSNWLIDKFYLDDFAIQLPEFLMIDPGDLADGEKFDATNNIYTNKRITIEKPGSGSKKFSLVSFNVKGLKGISVDEMGKTALNGNMNFSATARTPEGAVINPGDELTITPKLEISDIVVTGLDASLDLEDYFDNGDIDPIDFSELFEYLSDNQIQQPNLAAPVLTIDIVNPLGLDALGNITLYPRNADGDLICDEPITLGPSNRFRIEPATTGPVTTKIFITDDGVNCAPQEYTGYNLNLSDLVNVIPHTVDIALSGTVNPDKNLISSLLLGDDENEFKLNYKIEVPLAFGSDMDMELEFDVDDLNKTFSKLAEQKVKATDIAVFAGFTVTFPLVIDKVKVEFTDNQGDEIDGLKTTVSGSIQGPAKVGDQPQESVLAIGLTVPNGGDFTTLSEIDKMKITIPISSADCTENAQNQLSPDDTIEGRVWIELAKGVSVNLGDL